MRSHGREIANSEFNARLKSHLHLRSKRGILRGSFLNVDLLEREKLMTRLNMHPALFDLEADPQISLISVRGSDGSGSLSGHNAFVG